MAIAGAGGYFYWTGGSTVTPKDFKPTQKDYQKVYDEVARKLADETDYDDGSYGPVCLLPLSLFYGCILGVIQANEKRFFYAWHGTLVAHTTRQPAQEAVTAQRCDSHPNPTTGPTQA